MKIKTSELTESALDWAVAKCEGLDLFESEGWVYDQESGKRKPYQPSTNWTYGGPIIGREKMDFEWVDATNCRASLEWLDDDFFESFGPTPLIAAMRCYVESKLGDEIDIPDVLA